MLRVLLVSVLFLIAVVLLSNCTSDVTSPEPEEPEEVESDTFIEYSSELWFLNKFEGVDSCLVEYGILGEFWEEIAQDSIYTHGSFERHGMKLVYLDNN